MTPLFATAITKAEMIVVMGMYFTPIYKLIGAILAVLTISAAYWVVLHPFVKRVAK